MAEIKQTRKHSRGPWRAIKSGMGRNGWSLEEMQFSEASGNPTGYKIRAHGYIKKQAYALEAQLNVEEILLTL